ncbi:hypothetical protein NUU61_010005 [Penicillium alfredii]|uniref:RNA polymerase II subunit B1 CTD phosphatase RPAP2 homolog n=1 Tax=Penicillium alfredii TaxID=1506179 RepID=A0A9W9EH76_9EURO|nr:uncharacterized protein NUU61_010005 [Penicillium alfredii]KAJ5081741.1 hypothetical protein NUU61_010005 [Penicillium alfredii]
MTTPSGPPKPALKTSLPSAFAATNAQQPKPSYPELSQEQQEKYLSARPGATPHHLGVALQHAHQIQAQKDAEDLILDHILNLLEIPSSPTADPAAPSTEDAQAFKSVMAPFRPSDYDNLILERNYNQQCGYVLCPHQHRKEDAGTGSSFHFKWGAKGSGPGGRGRSMDIVSRDKIEKWCSDECAERALYIRVQLSEQPVWERRADDMRGKQIVLLEEARAKKQAKSAAPTSHSQARKDVADKMQELKIQDPERARELALERGDTSAALRDGRVDFQIRENQQGSRRPVTTPQRRPEDTTGGSIEGYVPKDRRDQRTADHEDEDVLDQI